MDLLAKVKVAMGIVVDVFDSELSRLIRSAKLDLGIAGVVLDDNVDELIENAIITYCKFNFQSMPGDEYDRIKASYDEQKGQLRIASGYTDWSV